MKFLVLGASGMAGHVISIYLQEQGHDVKALTRKPIDYCENIICDITNFDKVQKIIEDGNYDAVVNCIGILNQYAEQNKGYAVLLNSYLPHFLCEITKNMKTKVVHMSTDCVFSGETGSYTEDSFPDGTTFYDRSKALGEINNDKDLTFRNSIIGPDMNKDGIGLLNWFLNQNQMVNGYTKAIWTGVTTLTLAKAIEKAVETNLVGLYHLVNNEEISKYNLLRLFNKYFKDEMLSINTNESVVIDKSLINKRFDFNFSIPSYEGMVAEMHEWVMKHKELYPHYINFKMEDSNE